MVQAMPSIAHIIDDDLPFTRLAELSKAVALAYRASAELLRTHPILQTNPTASAGYIRRACVDHFLANIPRNLPNSGLTATLESNKNRSSSHIVLRSPRLVMTAHHVKSSRTKMLKSRLYSKTLSSPNFDLFSDNSGEAEFEVAYGQILHGAGPSLEFMSLVIPDSECKVAQYTRPIPLPSIEEVKEEKIDDEINNLFESIFTETRAAK